jgi:hypothetical protein
MPLAVTAVLETTKALVLSGLCDRDGKYEWNRGVSCAKFS